MFPGGGGFCASFLPMGRIFAKSSRSGGQGFDHVKKVPEMFALGID